MPVLMTAGQWNNRKTPAHYTERQAASGRSAQLLQGRTIGKEDQATNKEGTMTTEEQQLLEQYLAHLNVLGKEGTHPDFDAWYQEVRYAQGPSATHTLMEASELRYKDVLDAARVFNLSKQTYRQN